MDRRDGEPRPPIYDVQPLRLLRDLFGITDEAVKRSRANKPGRDDVVSPPDNTAPPNSSARTDN